MIAELQPLTPERRLEVVRIARGLVETPFHHMGRLPGVGLDCVGVVICVARALGIVAEDFDVDTYARVPDSSSLIDLCGLYMRPIPQAEMQVGDIVVFAIRREPQHLGILGNYPYGGFSIIHATPPKVVETRLMYSRVLKFATAFQLLEVV